MLEKLKEKQKILQTQIQEKVQQFQNADNIRNQLLAEVSELQGKLKMIQELIEENKKEELSK